MPDHHLKQLLHSVLKCKGQIKSSYSRKPMVVYHQLGQVGWRSSLGTSTFGLLCLFNGHKLPKNAIKCAFLAIGGSSVNVYQLGAVKRNTRLGLCCKNIVKYRKSIIVATYGQKCMFYGNFWAISAPLEAPGGNFSGSKWPQQTTLDVSHPDPTKIH